MMGESHGYFGQNCNLGLLVVLVGESPLDFEMKNKHFTLKYDDKNQLQIITGEKSTETVRSSRAKLPTKDNPGYSIRTHENYSSLNIRKEKLRKVSSDLQLKPDCNPTRTKKDLKDHPTQSFIEICPPTKKQLKRLSLPSNFSEADKENMNQYSQRSKKGKEDKSISQPDAKQKELFKKGTKKTETASQFTILNWMIALHRFFQEEWLNSKMGMLEVPMIARKIKNSVKNFKAVMTALPTEKKWEMSEIIECISTLSQKKGQISYEESIWCLQQLKKPKQTVPSVLKKGQEKDPHETQTVETARFKENNPDENIKKSKNSLKVSQLQNEKKNKLPYKDRVIKCLNEMDQSRQPNKLPEQLISSVSSERIEAYNDSLKTQTVRDFSYKDISFSIEQESRGGSFEQSVQSLEDILAALREEKNQRSCVPELQPLLSQLMDYCLYKHKGAGKNNLDDEYFQALKIQSITVLEKSTQSEVRQWLDRLPLREYFSMMEGIKIVYCPSFISELIPYLHHNIRILNLSCNELCGISDLMQLLKPRNRVQFLNLNHNRLRNISGVLSRCPDLVQLHAKGNLIDHVSGETFSNSKLEIVDLAYNEIQLEEDLSAFRFSKSLKILNLLGNSLTTSGQQWKGLLPKEVIYLYSELEMMSEYVQYKDMAFERNALNRHKGTKEEPDNLSKHKIKRIKTYFNQI